MNSRINSLIILLTALLFVLSLGCGGKLKLEDRTPEELMTEGLKKYNKEKFIQSTVIFQTLIYNYPGEMNVDSSQYYLAMSYFGNKEYIVAEREFNRLQLNYPSSVFANHASFMRAVCLYEGTPKHYGLDQSELGSALVLFEDFIVDHPESELMGEAQKYVLEANTRLAKKIYSAGTVYSNIDKIEPARVYFQRVIDEYTDTKFAALAAYELALLKMREKDYVAAEQHFNDFSIVFDSHELAPKAKQNAQKAAFTNAETQFKGELYELAKTSLEQFILRYPASDKLKKAKKYLSEIPANFETTSSDNQVAGENEG